MKFTLNSRVLIGRDHELAAGFVDGYLADSVTEIEWLQSPSARCVLTLSPADPNLHIQLEQDLRADLGLSIYTGEDSSETEKTSEP